MGFRLPSMSRREGEGAARGFDVVPMRRRHLRAVVAIEQAIFPSPWSASLYLSELGQGSTRAYFVARCDGVVIGYAGLMLAVGEGHVTTIGVSQPWQRRGVGRMLLTKVARAAIERGAEALTLEVRVSNTGAQSLYHEFGFAPAGIRKNYYAEVHEDAIIMWAHGVQSAQYAERLDSIEKRLRPGSSPWVGGGGPP
ncbi:MAG: ribosomal protein S18-alanine N-acetyltransferase [Actinomycetota bacterium]|nr:ribosomal protein S18-alanine N-acetyltransferase [Actinomycetota bacterium]